MTREGAIVDEPALGLVQEHEGKILGLDDGSHTAHRRPQRGAKREEKAEGRTSR